jgi:hypothetical protein
MKMNFSFILFLALCPIEDLHVKLRRATVIVEKQKEALMHVMILCKMGPAALEVHLTIAVILNLHLIWRSFTRFAHP